MSKKKKRPNDDTVDVKAMIDKIFAETVQIKVGDTIRRTTCFIAISHQLWIQSGSGSRKAGRLFRRYARFATSHTPELSTIEVRFEADNPTSEDLCCERGEAMP